LVQLQQQGQEVPVGVNGSAPDHVAHGVGEGQTAPQHQERQDQRRRAADTHDAMHQDLPCSAWRWGDKDFSCVVYLLI